MLIQIQPIYQIHYDLGSGWKYGFESVHVNWHTDLDLLVSHSDLTCYIPYVHQEHKLLYEVPKLHAKEEENYK